MGFLLKWIMDTPIHQAVAVSEDALDIKFWTMFENSFAKHC